MVFPESLVSWGHGWRQSIPIECLVNARPPHNSVVSAQGGANGSRGMHLDRYPDWRAMGWCGQSWLNVAHHQPLRAQHRYLVPGDRALYGVVQPLIRPPPPIVTGNTQATGIAQTSPALPSPCPAITRSLFNNPGTRGLNYLSFQRDHVFRHNHTTGNAAHDGCMITW